MYEVCPGSYCRNCKYDSEKLWKKQILIWEKKKEELEPASIVDGVLYTSLHQAFEANVDMKRRRAIQIYQDHLLEKPKRLCMNPEHGEQYLCVKCYKQKTLEPSKRFCGLCKIAKKKAEAVEELRLLEKKKAKKERKAAMILKQHQETLLQEEELRRLLQEKRQEKAALEFQKRKAQEELHRKEQIAQKLRNQEIEDEKFQKRIQAEIQKQEMTEKIRQQQIEEEKRRQRIQESLHMEEKAESDRLAALLEIISETPNTYKEMNEYILNLRKGGMRLKHPETKVANTPWPHQMQAVNKLLQHGGLHFLIINHEMGTGKTATVAQMYAALAAQKPWNATTGCPTMIVTVPTSTMEQWRETIKNWLILDDMRREHEDYVLVTNSSTVLITEYKYKKILITTPGCLSQIHKKYYHFYKYAVKSDKGKWTGAWMRKGGRQTDEGVVYDDELPPLGFPFSAQFDIMVIDEVQRCKNPKTAIAHLHHVIAERSAHRILLSGTIICNKPEDLSGIAYSGDCPIHYPGCKWRQNFQDPKSFLFSDKSHTTINKAGVLRFKNCWIHRVAVKDCNVYLPPLNSRAVNFQVNFTEEEATQYNQLLAQLRTALNNDKISPLDPKKKSPRFLSILTKMCFHIVHPIITLGAECGYTITKDSYLFEQAIENPSSSMLALLIELRKLKSGPNPHRRIVVASCFVIPLKIAKKWIDQYFSKEFGKTVMFTGEISTLNREKNKKEFLSAENSIMFLNILAGGVGLHLVPGCEAMIFWAALPYSPAAIDQCVARIQRFGQLAPLTGNVEIVYLFPYGSRDFGISNLHRDKRRVMDFAQDKNESGFDNEMDHVWRKSIAIIRDCSVITTANAESPFLNFPAMPVFSEIDLDGNRSIFSLMFGVPSFNQSGQILRRQDTFDMKETKDWYNYVKHMNGGNVLGFEPMVHKHYGSYKKNQPAVQDNENNDVLNITHESDDDIEDEY